MYRPLTLGRQQLPQAAIKSDKFASTLDGERQQVSVSHLPMTNQTTGAQVRDFRDFHVMREKTVMPMREVARQQFGRFARPDQLA